MANKTGIKAYFFIALAIVLWSTVASAFKIGLRNFTGFELLFLSIVVSVIALFFIVIVKYPENLKAGLNRKYFLVSAISGFINPFLYYIVLFKGYSILPAQIAQPINFVWPILLSLLAMVFLKQKLSIISFLALFVSFIGVVLVSTQGNIKQFNIPDIKGVLLCLLSSLLWAISWIISLKDSRIAAIKLFFSFLFAFCYITLYAFATDNIPTYSLKSIGVPVYIGLFEMSITFLLWLRALELSGKTAKMSNLIYLVPLLSLIIIHFVLNEKIYLTSIFGLMFIISGVILQVFSMKKA
jgi:drug/metabolite transporter (DMT)-like permease